MMYAAVVVAATLALLLSETAHVGEHLSLSDRSQACRGRASCGRTSGRAGSARCRRRYVPRRDAGPLAAHGCLHRHGTATSPLPHRALFLLPLQSPNGVVLFVDPRDRISHDGEHRCHVRPR